jgi:apolipoprotein N-acyltransferase
VQKGWQTWRWRLLAVTAGLLLALSFPRANVAGLAWIAPALLLWASRGSPFRLGWLGGFAHYLLSLNWLLHIPVRFYPVLGWLALAAYLALFPALWTWACSRVANRLGLGGADSTWLRRLVFALFAACAWVAMEMAVARMLSGFPWNLLGASQLQLTPLVQIASFTGVYGVAFLVIWFSASLVNVFQALMAQPTRREAWLRELALPILVIAIVYAWGVAEVRRKSAVPANRVLRIALVQPSIPQTMIWDPAGADARFRELLRLTEAALTNRPQIIIWPEAAVPKMVRDDIETQRAIARLAASNSAWMIIGSDDFDFRGTNAIFFNSSFLVSPRGELVSTYRKRRLVIFGEYVPLVDWFPFIKYLTPITGGFAAGEEPVTFELGELGAKTSVLICFEDVFPHYAREHVTPGLDFLVNITNDGWFGESSAHWQQAWCAAFRAIENGLPLVRCANNGLSCWIDARGVLHNVHFEESKNIYAAGVKHATVPIPSRASPTFYTRHGDVFGWACVALTLVVLIGTRFNSESRLKSS